MAITNPTKYVSVQRLGRFEEKLASKYASQAGLDEVRDAIGTDTDAFVDLGLPSGTLWAKCNIGATEETGYGNYYKYGKGAEEYSSSQSDYTGTEDPLAAAADTATVTLGLPWHMPTRAQFQELIANTTLTWEENFNGSGINGMKFTAQNGNYIFFPGGGERGGSNTYYLGEAGRYWSSTPNNSNRAYALRFGDEGNKYVDDNLRYSGYSVRPVCDSAPLVKLSAKADKATTYTKTEVDSLVENGYVRASFVGSTLVFTRGGTFSGSKLVIG